MNDLKNSKEEQRGITELVRYFIDTDRMHRTLVEERIGALKLHRSQHVMLQCIEAFETPPTQRALADRLGISAATVAVTVKKLESEGYIVRREADNDSRANCLSLTEKGHDILIRARDAFMTVDVGMFAGMSREELTRFAESLRKIQDNLAAMGAQKPCPRAPLPDKDEKAK